jgi:hypothetical protein
MRNDQPIYRPSVGHRITVETRDGDRVSGTYRGWMRRDDDVIVHQIRDGRARREVRDRLIASVVG